MRQRRLMNQINVVPYIDVMLVLLVIFMVTAPMIQTGSIDVPNASNVSTPPPEAATVRVTREGLALQRSPGAQFESMGNSELQRALQEMHAANAEQPIIVAAERSIEYDRVVTTLDSLRNIGFTKASLQTQFGSDR
jgi:biopolymer transport protein TolR